MLGSDDFLLRAMAEQARLRVHQGLHRLDDARRAGDRGQGRQPGRHQRLQVQPAQARSRREARLLRRHAARHHPDARARADGARRHASAAHPRLQPRRSRQRRDDARDHPRDGRPAAPPDAHPVPQLRHRRRHDSSPPARRADRRAPATRTRTSPSTSARSCSARPARPRATACASTATAPRTPTRRSGSSWTSSATPAAASCRSSIATRASSTRCSGRSGSRLFLLVDDPWRIFLTTDHPNGAPFYYLPAPDPPAHGPRLPQRHDAEESTRTR